MCGDCTRNAAMAAGACPPGAARVVAVELDAANARQLREVFAHFGVPGAVVHAGGSDTVGYAAAPAPEGRAVGAEDAQLGGAIEPGPSAKEALVATVTVDQLVGVFDLEPLDHLIIDTEGHDSAVLRGAERTLRRQGIRILEFEYHSIGLWRGVLLSDTIKFLGQFGYDCFWQGNRGELAAFVSNCSYEHTTWKNAHGNAWSNVVCAPEGEISRILQMHAQA